MIRHFSILLFTLITLSLSAEGIDFQYNSIYAASKAARVEGKMIFVYANTSSCDLCRSMEQKGFKNAEVVSFYKAHFVSVQLDMESPEGRKIGNAFDIRKYPAVLFLDAKGLLISKWIGYRSSSSLLSVGTKAVEHAEFYDYERRFEKGDNSLETVFNYVTRWRKMDGYIESDINSVIHQTLIKHKDSWSDPYAIGLMMCVNTGVDSKVGEFLIDHNAAVIEIVGPSTYMSNLQARFISMVSIEENVLDIWPHRDAMKLLYDRYAPNLASRLLSHYDFIMATKKNSLNYLPDRSSTYLDLFESDSGAEYFTMASLFYRDSDSIGVLDKARGYALKAISKSSSDINYYNLLLKIHQKMGNQSAAEKTSARIKKLAKDQGMKVVNKNRETN